MSRSCCVLRAIEPLTVTRLCLCFTILDTGSLPPSKQPWKTQTHDSCCTCPWKPLFASNLPGNRGCSFLFCLCTAWRFLFYLVTCRGFYDEPTTEHSFCRVGQVVPAEENLAKIMTRPSMSWVWWWLFYLGMITWVLVWMTREYGILLSLLCAAIWKISVCWCGGME